MPSVPATTVAVVPIQLTVTVEPGSAEPGSGLYSHGCVGSRLLQGAFGAVSTPSMVCWTTAVSVPALPAAGLLQSR
ncbi:hypothetical protein C6N19_20485 [Acinetobacter pittii]|nr:hypothetical protein [Acinetobacter pittii]QEE59236.1 hypothetical protein C6N19_20485 [Acinetobacter pittii]